MLVFAGIAIPFVLRPLRRGAARPARRQVRPPPGTGRHDPHDVGRHVLASASSRATHTIGIAAPILLLLARLVQGFSTGGEYGGAATFIAEYAPDHKRGFYGSFLEFGTLAGYVLGASLATAVQLGLPEEALLTGGGASRS